MSIDDDTDRYPHPIYTWDSVPDLPDAACNQPGMDPDWWYPTRGEDAYRAKSVCNTCPHQIECLAGALERRETYGIWGGRSENERRRIRRDISRGVPLEQAAGTVVLPLEWEIREWLANNPPATATTIATELGRRLSSVSGKLRELHRQNVIYQTGWHQASVYNRAAIWTLTSTRTPP